MIKENDIYSLIHYEYGLPYSGDYNGMRYRIARNPLERVFGKKEKEKYTNLIPNNILVISYNGCAPNSYHFDDWQSKDKQTSL